MHLGNASWFESANSCVLFVLVKYNICSIILTFWNRLSGQFQSYFHLWSGEYKHYTNCLRLNCCALL